MLEHVLFFRAALLRTYLWYLEALEFKRLAEASNKALLNFAKAIDVLQDDYFRLQ